MATLIEQIKAAHETQLADLKRAHARELAELKAKYEPDAATAQEAQAYLNELTSQPPGVHATAAPSAST